jgi:hypothetical protein
MMVIYVVHIIIIISLSFQCWRKAEVPLKTFFWSALLIKLISGIVLGLVYTYYYTAGDTFQYFNDGSLLAQLARDDLQAYIRFLVSDNIAPADIHLSLSAPRAVYFSKIVSIVSLVAGNNYWMVALYFSFFSFLGCWMLVRHLHRYFPGSTVPAVLAFLFIPSVVFWTSGIIKESLAFASLLILVSLFLKIWMRDRI